MTDIQLTPPARETVVMSSGYLPPSMAAVRQHFEVVDIVQQRQALAYLRQCDPLPAAVCIGYVTLHPSRDDLSAETMLQEILKLDPALPVVISTGQAAPSAIVDLVKRGAFDYVIEPRVNTDADAVARYTQDLVHALTRAVQWRQVVRENRQLKQDLVRQSVPQSMLVRGPEMLEVMDLVNKVAPTSATVLITGESGTGKELIARAIHSLSAGRGEPFTAVNCGALTEPLLASELFGHVKGAFTGADSDRRGLVREAGAGTLLLDEIGTVSHGFQVMLLRVLENRTARPVGGTGDYPVHCRFLAAANQDLDQLVARGVFRQDLFYRLNTFHIHLPPLRQRRRDIPVLAHHFLRQAARQYARGIQSIDPAAMNLLESHDWPGNIRQLRNVVERAVIVCEGDRVGVGDLDQTLRRSANLDAPVDRLQYHEAMRSYERRLLQAAIDRADGNLSLAARNLGMKRTTLNYRIAQLELPRKS
jgi:DNA-binding NtrC family response regulator